MLGTRVADPLGIEGAAGATRGLGLLDVQTIMGGDKRLRAVRARHVALDQPFTGYEIHIGRSDGPDCARPFAHVGGRVEGAVSADGHVAGSYLHGMFADDAFRAAWLADLGAQPSDHAHTTRVEATLEALADHLEAHLDVPGLLALAR